MQATIVEKFAIIVFDKASTTGTGHYHVVGFFKIFQKLLANNTGVIPKTCVESGLSAAGLVFIIANGAPRLFQHFGHIETGFGVQLIDKARDENVYVHYSEWEVKELCFIMNYKF